MIWVILYNMHFMKWWKEAIKSKLVTPLSSRSITFPTPLPRIHVRGGPITGISSRLLSRITSLKVDIFQAGRKEPPNSSPSNLNSLKSPAHSHAPCHWELRCRNKSQKKMSIWGNKFTINTSKTPKKTIPILNYNINMPSRICKNRQINIISPSKRETTTLTHFINRQTTLKTKLYTYLFHPSSCLPSFTMKDYLGLERIYHIGQITNWLFS